MLKTVIFACTLLAGAASPAAAQEKGPEIHVTIVPTLSRDTLQPGSGAEVLFTFTPKKGFHVNAIPPMAVKFDSNAPAREGGKILIPADSATGYLKASNPVRQPFTVPAGQARGRADVKGVLTYYYCSDTEGWCRKEILRFAVPLTVR